MMVLSAHTVPRCLRLAFAFFFGTVVACPAGYYQQTGPDCLRCSFGFYQPSTGATSCLSCPAGYYCPYVAQTSVDDNCAAGRFSLAGSAACSECYAGTFQANPEAQRCDSCPSGNYCSTPGLTAVTGPCPSGTYSSNGATACATDCLPGTYMQMYNCIQCPSGTYSSTIGASHCKPCPFGTVSLKPGATACGMLITTEADLADPSFVISGATLEIGNNISLSGTINIKRIHNLTISGNGYHITGKNLRIFYIYRSQHIYIKNLNVAEGYSLDGGGLYISKSHATLEACLIFNNEALNYGGGMYFEESHVTIISCLVASNIAHSGGGVYADERSFMRSESSAFSFNHVHGFGGGGVYIKQSILTLDLCVISSNIAIFGTIAGWKGGGLQISQSVATVTSTIISNNLGAAFGGGISIVRQSHVNMSSSSIRFNSAAGGGGMYGSDSTLTLKDCVILSNMALPVRASERAYAGRGGGIFLEGIPVTPGDKSKAVLIDGCVVLANRALQGGGGLHVSQCESLSVRSSNFTKNNSTRGGGVFVGEYSIVSIDSSTVMSNEGRFGSGMYCSSSQVVVRDSTFSSFNVTQYGSALYCLASFVEVFSSLFSSRPAEVFVLEVGTAATLRAVDFKARGAIEVAGSGAPNVACASKCSAGEYASCTTIPGAQDCFMNCVCQQCKAGTFNPVAESTSAGDCLDCTAGFVADVGSVACFACGVGKFATRSSTDNSGGSVAPITSGAQYCNSCPPGRFAPSKNEISCQRCGTSLWSGVGASNCTVCDESYYLPRTNTNSELECGKCPKNSICEGGTSMPRPESNFWVDRKQTDSFPQTASQVMKCYRNTCVAAEKRLECWDLTNRLDSWAVECSSDSIQCTDGSMGPLCGACRKEFIFSAAKNTCVTCKESYTYIYIFLSCAFIATLVVCSSRLDFVTQSKFVDSLHPWRTIGPSDGLFRITWSNYQILQSISTNVIIFPPAFNSLLSLFSLDFLSLSCFLPHERNQNQFASVYVFSFTPIAVALLSLGVFAARFIARDGSLNVRLIWRSHARFLLLLSYLTLPSVLRTQCTMFDCITVPSGSYLRIDTSVRCTGPAYETFMIVNILSIIVYISVFFIWLVVLCRNRHRLNPSVDDIKLKRFLRDRDEGLHTLKFLYEPYAPDYFYFELLEMARRVTFVCIIPLLSDENTSRSAWGAFASIFSLVLYREMWPFVKRSANILAYVAQIALTVTFASALAIEAGLTSNVPQAYYGAGLVVVNCLVASLVVSFELRRVSTLRLKRSAEEFRKATVIEDATSFSVEKFNSIIGTIEMSFVPPSSCLVFWYGSLVDATKALNGGLRALAWENGIVFTCHRPDDLDEADRRVFSSQEVVLACRLPRRFLGVLPGGPLDGPLRFVSGDVLKALRGSYFGDLKDPQPCFDGAVVLPPRQIVRAYQLAQGGAGPPRAVPKYLSDIAATLPPRSRSDSGLRAAVAATDAVAPESCLDFVAQMSKLRALAAGRALLPVYHFTQAFLGPAIAESGLRMSTTGQGDGGVYFSVKGPASYGLGSAAYEDNIIVDCFGAGRLAEYRGKQKLDLVIVYGIEPWALTQAPGGRDNAVMVSKATFDALALPTESGAYFLRPDRILGMLLLPAGPVAPAPDGFEEAAGALSEEEGRDAEVKRAIAAVQRGMDEGESSLRRVLRQCGARSDNAATGDGGASDGGKDGQDGQDGHGNQGGRGSRGSRASRGSTATDAGGFGRFRLTTSTWTDASKPSDLSELSELSELGRSVGVGGASRPVALPMGHLGSRPQGPDPNSSSAGAQEPKKKAVRRIQFKDGPEGAGEAGTECAHIGLNDGHHGHAHDGHNSGRGGGGGGYESKEVTSNPLLVDDGARVAHRLAMARCLSRSSEVEGMLEGMGARRQAGASHLAKPPNV